MRVSVSASNGRGEVSISNFRHEFHELPLIREIRVSLLSRCRMYVNLIRDKVAANTQLGISPDRITGLVVADKFSKRPAVRKEIPELEKSNLFTFEWEAQLEESKRRWQEFLEILSERAPDDPRLSDL